MFGREWILLLWIQTAMLLVWFSSVNCSNSIAYTFIVFQQIEIDYFIDFVANQPVLRMYGVTEVIFFQIQEMVNIEQRNAVLSSDGE